MLFHFYAAFKLCFFAGVLGIGFFKLTFLDLGCKAHLLDETHAAYYFKLREVRTEEPLVASRVYREKGNFRAQVGSQSSKIYFPKPLRVASLLDCQLDRQLLVCQKKVPGGPPLWVAPEGSRQRLTFKLLVLRFMIYILVCTLFFLVLHSFEGSRVVFWYFLATLDHHAFTFFLKLRRHWRIVVFRTQIASAQESNKTPAKASECPICLDSFHISACRVLQFHPCQHVAHESCFQSWIESDNYRDLVVICMLCRRPVERFSSWLPLHDSPHSPA